MVGWGVEYNTKLLIFLDFSASYCFLENVLRLLKTRENHLEVIVRK